MYEKYEYLEMPALKSARSVLEWAVGALLILYLGLLVLVPDVYNLAPALLFLLSLVCFRRDRVVDVLERQDHWFLLAFVGYFLIYVVLNLWHREDAGNYDRPSRFLGAALILTLLLRVKLQPLVILSGAAVGGVVTGFYALYQAFGNGVGRVTTYDNAIYFGNGSMVLALVAFCGLLYTLLDRSISFRWTALYTLGCVSAGLAVMLSGTRGGWIAVPPIFFLFVWTYRRYARTHRMIMAASVGALAVFCVAALSLDIVTARVDVAMEEARGYFEDERIDTSVGLRLEMWKAGWLLFSENPVMGVGEGNFDEALSALVAAGSVDEGVLVFRHLHNQLVDNAAKGGVLAVLALVLAFLVPLRLFWQRLQSADPVIQVNALLGASFIIAFMVFSLTQGMLSRNVGVMMYILVPIMAWALIRQRERSLGSTSKLA